MPNKSLSTGQVYSLGSFAGFLTAIILGVLMNVYDARPGEKLYTYDHQPIIDPVTGLQATTPPRLPNSDTGIAFLGIVGAAVGATAVAVFRRPARSGS